MLKGFLKISSRDGLYWVALSAGLLVLFSISGCGSFFEKKTTEIQTRDILREIEQPREIQGLKNPLPEIYRSRPRRMTVKDGVKLFYFTKHHPVDKLAKLVTEQMGNKVTLNEATNQLIIHCADDADADKVLNYLEMTDVPPIQVNIDCIVLDRFADVTLDWETTLMVEDLLGEKITLGGKTDSSGNLLPTFPGAALREGARRSFGLDIGYWKDRGVSGHQIRAVVDLLVSRGYLKILMNPQLETINGQPAKITSRENVPLQKLIFNKAGQTQPFESTEYQWVEDTLEVTPRVYADGSIGLKTKVQIGSKSKPEGVVQVSVITERNIDIQENRIKPGDSLVVGGLRKSEKRSVIRGVPFFKDIPVVGTLFSSKDLEEKATEIIFIMTPSISSGGMPYEQTLEEVKRKHQTPDYQKGWEDYLTNPLDKDAYSESAKKAAQQAELEKRKAEIKRAEAMKEIEQIRTKLVESTEEVMTEKAKAAKALSEAERIKQEAEKAKAQAQQAAKEYEEVKKIMLKAQQQAEDSKKESAPAADNNQPQSKPKEEKPQQNQTKTEQQK